MKISYNMKAKTLLLTALFSSALITTTAIAQEKENATAEKTDSAEVAKNGELTLSGSTDMYYRYDILGKSKANNMTSFTNSHNAFELGMASVQVEYQHKTVGVFLDLGFGKRANEFSYNEALAGNSVLAAVKQAFLTYQPKDWVKITAGSWATHVGYELVDPQLNSQYSTSYLFSNGPFFHTGVKVELFKGPHSFMVGIANPNDFKYSSGGMNFKTALAQYSVEVSPKLSVYLNYAGGQAPDSILSNQIDLVLFSKISKKFSIGFNGTVSFMSDIAFKKSTVTNRVWHGQALYLNFAPKKWGSLNLRLEHFGDPKQLKVLSGASGGGSLFETTLSANFKTHGLTFIPEVRFDGSTQKVFTLTDGTATNYNASFTVAIMYNFSVSPRLRKKK
ncbi:MAG: porin [Flavobacteriales bacterium]|nr:porin [Flavobacteriales bacterium]